MRILVLSLLLASAAVLGMAADKGTISGKWQVRQIVSDHESTQTCTFTQSGNDLSGYCASEDKTLPVSGKIDDKKITWTYKSEYNGSPLTIKYTGTIDPQNKISGTVLVEEFSVEGEFTATQAQ